jgi:hypothetical protein
LVPSILRFEDQRRAPSGDHSAVLLPLGAQLAGGLHFELAESVAPAPGQVAFVGKSFPFGEHGFVGESLRPLERCHRVVRPEAL